VIKHSLPGLASQRHVKFVPLVSVVVPTHPLLSRNVADQAMDGMRQARQARRLREHRLPRVALTQADVERHLIPQELLKLLDHLIRQPLIGNTKERDVVRTTRCVHQRKMMAA
jgi:hypothetical protein